MPARFWKLLARALRLRCPLCGQGKLYRKPLRMYEHCPHCGIRYEREGGFFLGAIYFDYGLTALIVAIAYPILFFAVGVPSKWLNPASLAFVLIFPVLFHSFARSLWAGFDQFVDPRPLPTAEEEESEEDPFVHEYQEEEFRS